MSDHDDAAELRRKLDRSHARYDEMKDAYIRLSTDYHELRQAGRLVGCDHDEAVARLRQMRRDARKAAPRLRPVAWWAAVAATLSAVGVGAMLFAGL